MVRQKRYITFYTLMWRYHIPYIKTYGLACTRSWYKCLKLGIKHIKKGSAMFFTIEKCRPKKT